MKKSFYGPCGLYCRACGDKNCTGCQSNTVDKYVSNCKFRTCAKEKGLEFCCFCSDYPCKELKEFMTDKWPHHWTMKPNLTYIKKHGTENWLKAQDKEWSCDSCGNHIMWYQEKCKCGKQLDAWDIPL